MQMVETEAGLFIPNKMGIKTDWFVKKYEDDKALAANDPYEIIHTPRNIILDEGAAVIGDLLIGAGAPTVYNNTNARIAVGNAETPTAITGTSITMTNGSSAVSGIGTSFTTQLAVGDLVRVDSVDTFAEVQSITDNTNLVLTAVFAGATGTGVGSFIDAPVSTSTDLLGASKFYKTMEATYPSRAANVITFRSIMAAAEANFRWLEFSIGNAASGTGDNLNRRLAENGTKVSPQAWTVDVTLTIQ